MSVKSYSSVTPESKFVTFRNSAVCVPSASEIVTFDEEVPINSFRLYTLTLESQYDALKERSMLADFVVFSNVTGP
jgi:hypothetical protein